MKRMRAYVLRLIRRVIGIPILEHRLADIHLLMTRMSASGGLTQNGQSRVTSTHEALYPITQLAHTDYVAVNRLLDASRKPTSDLSVSFYISQRSLSYVVWELFSREAYLHFARTRKTPGRPKLEGRGFWQGQISDADAETLQAIFAACPTMPFSGNDHDGKSFYEPRLPNHEYLDSTNTYFQPTAQLRTHIESLLKKLTSEIENLCGHFWRVASWRVFALKPESREYDLHVDGWPPAIKKLFFYPAGVGKANGTTEFMTPDGHAHFIDGGKGTWALFENSVAKHRPCASELKVPRPTIEIDLVPALSTDTTLVDAGVNGWYPWFPLWEDKALDPVLPAHATLTTTKARLLKRILGLAPFVPNGDLSFGQDPHFDPR